MASHWLAALLLFAVTGWLVWLAQQGSLTNLDEFHTAERSREILLLGPGAVHENFAPSFEKPPLQYWLSAVTLSLSLHREMAVRFWPLLYGVGTVVALWLLTKTARPERSWVAGGSVALLLTCALFLTEMGRALLDTGLTFFATGALLFAQWARRRDVWWIGVAMFCSLGALQKGPLVFALFLLVLANRFADSATRPTLRSKWRWFSLSVAIVGVLAWPLWEMIRNQMPWSRLFGWQEAFELVGAERLGARPYLEIPFRLTTAWPCGIFALAAAIYWLRRRDDRVLAEMALVSLAVIVVGVVFGFRSARYVMPVLPLLCLLLAAGLSELYARGRRGIFFGTLAAVVVLASAGWLVTKQTFDRRRKDHSAELRAAEALAKLARSRARLILLEPDKRILPIQFYLFYGQLQRPVEACTLSQLSALSSALPAAGVCDRADFFAVRAHFPSAVIREESGRTICWLAE